MPRPGYVLVCRAPLGPALEPYVDTRVRITARLWLIVPVSNSAAHRIAERTMVCKKYFVRDVDEAVRLASIVAKFINDDDDYDCDVNDLTAYPTMVYSEEKVYEDDATIVTYYNAGEGEGYLAQSKKTGDVMHVYVFPF